MPGVAVARGALVVLTMLLLAPTAAASDQETLYLGTDGFPQASLVGNPLGGELPNFDRGRDIEPGLLLEVSTLGQGETDPARYQQWHVEAGGRRISGYPAVVIWSAAAGFESEKHGALSVYLLDCTPAGTACEELGRGEATISQGEGESWVESSVLFDQIDHTFAVGRHLVVKVVVPSDSEVDMMIAYGYARQRSRLTIYSEPPALPEAMGVAERTPTPFSHDLREKMHTVSTGTGELVQSGDPGPSWEWFGALAASTVFLVGLGALLVSRLSRPGRHEARATVMAVEPGRDERIPVSVR
jgi:hypothetical protein